MRRIMVIGPSGSGKSTLAQKLSLALGISAYHLDRLNFSERWIETPREYLFDQHNLIIDKDTWIIDGNYRNNTDIKRRMELADTIIYLEVSTLRSLYNIILRRIKYNGKTRPSLAPGCEEKLDFEFLLWVLSTGKRKPDYQRIVDEMARQNKQVIVLHNRKEINDFVEKVRTTMG